MPLVVCVEFLRALFLLVFSDFGAQSIMRLNLEILHRIQTIVLDLKSPPLMYKLGHAHVLCMCVYTYVHMPANLAH